MRTQVSPHKTRLMQAVIKKGTGWYQFQNPEKIWKATSVEEVKPMMDEADTWARSNRGIIAGYVAYEASPAFDKAMPERDLGSYLLVLGGFTQVEEIDQFKVPASGAQFKSITNLLKWKEGVTEDQYEAGFREIRERIKNGDSYQVNYTWPLQAKLKGKRAKRDAQMRMLAMSMNGVAAPQAAWIEFEDVRIASASPELFFSRIGDELKMRPMKGTAVRHLNARKDEASKNLLIKSAKEQAENLMIVDMIRNDLSRICDPETVKVPHLFSVEKYPTVWQLTSTITGKLEKKEPSLAEVFGALFPCASITGAPKISSMNIIQNTEPHSRGVYTGAIGFWDPSNKKAEFSVAIRTAVGNIETGALYYGTGSGVVWDSESEKEWEECHQKTKVLTQSPSYWKLLETMLFVPSEQVLEWKFPFLAGKIPINDGIVLGNYHWARLKVTANCLGFRFSEEKFRNLVTEKTTESSEPLKIRILVGMGGAIMVETDSVGSESEIEVEIASAPIHSSDWRLHFKTTNRLPYNQFETDADDILLWNERNEITETRIGNLIYRLNNSDRWYTPPCSSGLLNGTLRQWLLEQNVISERILKRDELGRVDDWYRINSVRGVQEMWFKLPE